MDEEDPILPPVSLQQAPDDKDVRRQELFCSKIIHQRSGQQQMRFRHHAPYLKIVLHSHPNCTGPGPRGEYPRPTSSPFPCHACHRRFDTPPVFLPMTALDGTREEWGNFCCAPCVNRYLHTNMNDSNLAARAADMLEYMQDVHGFRGSEIGMAPHFSERLEYGGDLTDDQFMAVVGNPALTTTLRMFPFIPTPSVVEWCFTGTAPLSLPPLPGVVHHQQQQAAAAAVTATPTGGVGGPAGHHHEWEVRNLTQPSRAAIEQRLASLPPLEQRTGLYELYLQSKGGLDAPLSDDEAEQQLPAPKQRARPGNKPAGTGTAAARKRSNAAAAAAIAAPTDGTAAVVPTTATAAPPSRKRKPSPAAAATIAVAVSDAAVAAEEAQALAVIAGEDPAAAAGGAAEEAAAVEAPPPAKRVRTSHKKKQ